MHKYTRYSSRHICITVTVGLRNIIIKHC